MRTDLRSLEILLAIAEHGSISGAARGLGMQQPSVSDRVQQLERRLRLSLLERSPRGSRLTPEGATVTDWAREIFAAVDRLEAGVAALCRQQDGHLQVSASMTIAEYLLPRWLAELHRQTPDTAVALRVRNSADAAFDVLHGDADIGFVEGPTVPRGLGHRTFGTDELVVVVAPDHPWARLNRPLSSQELVAGPLVVRETGSGTREALEQAVAEAGVGPLRPELELGSTATIKAVVLGGKTASVLSSFAAADDVAAGRLCVLRVEGLALVRPLRLIWREGEVLNGAAAQLVRLARCGPEPRATDPLDGRLDTVRRPPMSQRIRDGHAPAVQR